MPFTLVRQDITKMKVDAIVNAASTELKKGGGVSGAIFTAAGAADLQAACDKFTPIKIGEAVITPGFQLSARFIIHTAGPVYRDGKSGEEALLRACYINSLKRALENRCQSVAFPLISSGIYGYPKEEALRVATGAIEDFLGEQGEDAPGGDDLQIFLAVLDKTAYLISKKQRGEIESFIDEHYMEKRWDKRREHLLAVEQGPLDDSSLCYGKVAPSPFGLEALIGNLDEPFSQTLLRLIDAKGRTDVEVYKRANLSRQLFSKIRTRKGYMPSKRTAIALAIGLELTLEETADLLKRAGYALSRSQKFDVIIEYFIRQRNYDIYEINTVLFEYDQPLLGG